MGFSFEIYGRKERKDRMKKFRKEDVVPIIWACSENRLFGGAAELTYYLVFAFFPMIMFFTALLSFFQNTEETIQQFLSFLPLELQAFLTDYSTYIYGLPGLLPLLLGAGMMLYSFTRALHVLGFHICRIYGRTRWRRTWRAVIRSAFFTLFFITLILLNFILIAFGRFFLILLDRYTAFSEGWLLLFEIGRFAIPMILGFFFILNLYERVPGGAYSFWDALPGTLFSLIAWGIASVSFSFYADRFARYSLLYGSISSVILLFIWLDLTSFLLLFGAQLNAYLRQKG